MKKRLTQTEEFEILKLVFDKFLWLGFVVMAYGMYKMISDISINGIYFLIAGAAVLIILMIIIVKEYEIAR
jgi:hypothetical protein